MNKRILILLALLVLGAFALSACQQATPQVVKETVVVEKEVTKVVEKEVEVTKVVEKEVEVVATPTPSAEELDPLGDVDPSGQTVTYWYQHSRSREEGLTKMIERFNANNEWGITVNGEYQGHYGEIYKKMLAAIASGEVPSLVVAYQNQSASYQLADALVDLNPYVHSAKWGFSDEELNDFFPAFLNADISQQFGGMRLGFPPNRSIEVMYYNADWLKELGYDAPPATWDEFKEMACKAAQTPYSKGPADAKPMGYEISTDASRFASMVFSRGGDLMNEDMSAYTLNTPASQDAMQFMQDLYKEGCADIIAEKYGDQSDFGVGKLLFTIGSSSGLPYYKSAVNDGAGFNWSVAALPHTTPDPVVDIYGASLSVPKTNPEEQLASWLFVKWFTEPEQQAEWAQISNYFPVRKSTAAELGDYFAQNPAYATAFGLLKYGKVEPPVAGYDVARNKISEAYNAILEGADVQETLAQLDKDANDILAENQP
jgi:multiple sugar transport system substrate-binding protein/sn-glycerol 3-phosphate transport system substrate-binding protein